MDRLQEINHKHEQLRQLLHARGAETLWLQRTNNISWITAGANPAIPTDSETAPYSVIVTADRRAIVTDNIELPRLRSEERFEDLGFEFAASPWYASQPPSMPHMISDIDAAVDAELQKLRSVLSEPEQMRFRALGFDAAAALEEAIFAVKPGDTEWEIGARLDAACRKRGGIATVNLVATDERILQFRHPYITDKPLVRYAMIVVCMRRGGLVVAGTRLAHFGALPADLREKLHKVAAIDAAVMVASRPGRTLGEVFADIQQAYADQGEADQWQNHHQGGTIAYKSREIIATPGDPTLIEVGHAFAWNPSIVGCKSEDTILLGANSFEVVTQTSPDFPTIEVEAGGQTVKRPGILEL